MTRRRRIRLFAHRTMVFKTQAQWARKTQAIGMPGAVWRRVGIARA